MIESKTDKTLDKMIDLGIMTSGDEGIRFSPDWQKLIYNSIQISAKKWHDAGRKGDLKTFDEIEKLIMKKFPKLDPLLEVEIAYYVTAISKDLLQKGIKK